MVKYCFKFRKDRILLTFPIGNIKGDTMTISDHISNMKTDKNGKSTLTGKVITFLAWALIGVPFIVSVVGKLIAGY